MTDAAAFAGGVVALEHHNNRHVFEFGMARQGIEPALVLFSSYLELILIKRLFHVQGFQQVQIVDRWHQRWCKDLGWWCFFLF